MFTTLIKRFISNLFNLNSLIINLLSLIFLLIPACKKDLYPIEISKSLKFPPPCIDTTSHNFIWQIDTLPGTVFDIAALDENNVWLVGEFSKYNPETGKYSKYNFGKWDGSKWNLESVDIRGKFDGIYVFDENDIWVTNGVIRHWDGNKWTRYHLWYMGVLSENDGGVHKILGLSKNNILFIGNKGTIVHYDGNSFTKMESGTSIDLTHIYGLDKNNIWVVGDDHGLDGGQSVLLFYNGTNWNVKYHRYYEDNTPPENAYKGIWADQDSLILVNVWGYWHESISTGKGRQEHISILPAGYTRDFFANNRNDIFKVGDFQTIHHFNGKSWKSYISFDRNNHNIFWAGTYISKDIVFVGGNKYIHRGYR